MFDQLGGVEAMTEWAQENRGEFYRGLYSRLLPSESQIEIDDGRERPFNEYTDQELDVMIRDCEARLAMLSPDPGQ